jgi:activator of 2-hydroxyglutaryl-CoA dehydratase
MTTPQKLIIGVDVGSTTVKLCVVHPETLEILWSKYERHETRQPEKTFEMLTLIKEAFPTVKDSDFRLFITGSGGGPIAPHLGAKFVQEVNAVTMAVEKLHPDVGSVIELGGQDAKIIMFKKNEETGDQTAQTSMNDKCASGTGATIDKCVLKVAMPREEVPGLVFDPTKLHHVAAKCGVFAETDIVNLVKSGIPRGEIMNSLADAIVSQNLAVLTRGNTLKAKVLLLGGPNTYLPFLQQCWRLRIPESWDERGYEYDKTVPIEELIFVPKNAEYYAAYGAVLFGIHEPANVGDLPRPRSAQGVHPPRSQGQARRVGRPRAGRRGGPAPDLRRQVPDPALRGRQARGRQGLPRRDRPRRRLDLVEVRPHRRQRDDPEEGLRAVEGQPDPGHAEMFAEMRSGPPPRARRSR